MTPDPTGHPLDPIRQIADDMEAERRAKSQDRARVLLALADRVCAEEPSRELRDAVLLEIGWEVLPDGRTWARFVPPDDFENVNEHDAPNPLASLDAAASAAALDRLHKLPADFKREARAGSEGVRADYLLISICTAQADAAMLRAALEDKG